MLHCPSCSSHKNHVIKRINARFAINGAGKEVYVQATKYDAFDIFSNGGTAKGRNILERGMLCCIRETSHKIAINKKISHN